MNNIDINSEEWRQIPLYTNYFITKQGDVYSKASNKILKPALTRQGYMLTLYRNNIQSSFKVSQLVAETYLEKPEGANCVTHIDNDKFNNDVSNLQWIHRVRPPVQANAARRRRIQCVELNMEFESVRECAEVMKLSYKDIEKSLRTNCPTRRRDRMNYTFKYLS